MHKRNILAKWFVATDTWPQRRNLTRAGKTLRLMFDLRILKCSHIPSIRRIILIYIKPRCSWYVWTIPPLSGASEGPRITPQGCQPKKRQEGLWAVDITNQTVCSQRWNPDRERVGVRQQSAYFIHRVAIYFLFSVAQLQHLADLCLCAIIWAGLLWKCFVKHNLTWNTKITKTLPAVVCYKPPEWWYHM